MAGTPTKAHEAAREWMQKHPSMPARTAARHLHKLRPKLYTSVEHARTTVRSVIGQNGTRTRKEASDKSQYRKPGSQHDGKVVIPEGVSEFKQPVEISGPCKVLVMGDLHIPYHDKRAVETAINEGLKQGCDTLYLNGDFCDFYGVSRFEKNPENRDMAEELIVQEEVLDILKPLFKRKYFKCGNHDERWEKYLFSNAPALGRIPKLRLHRILELEERGYQWVDSKQWAMVGQLPLFHGHELQGGSGVNPARGAYLKVTNTIAVSHHHRTSQHTETQSLSQTLIVTWSLGCLCDMRPSYAVVNKWNLGAAIVTVDAAGSFEVQNFKIDPTNNYAVYR